MSKRRKIFWTVVGGLVQTGKRGSHLGKTSAEQKYQTWFSASKKQSQLTTSRISNEDEVLGRKKVWGVFGRVSRQIGPRRGSGTSSINPSASAANKRKL